MKIMINCLNRVLCVLLVCRGFVFASCEMDDLLCGDNNGGKAGVMS